MSNDTVFKFNPNVSLCDNFNLWYQTNREEREAYGEPLLNRVEAVSVFSKLYNVAAVEVQESMDEERNKFSYKV